MIFMYKTMERSAPFVKLTLSGDDGRENGLSDSRHVQNLHRSIGLAATPAPFRFNEKIGRGQFTAMRKQDD